MKKYHLVIDFNKSTHIEEIKLLSYDERLTTVFTTLSPGYASIDELKAGENIQKEKCAVCGGLISCTYIDSVNDELKEHKMCYLCNFWRVVVKIMHEDNNRLIINGNSYHIRVDAPNAYFKGYGGKKFRITRFSEPDKIIETHNLWHQGKVPELWREKLPDNAKFVENE